MAKKTLKSTKARAWKVFSEYIRRKYSKDGIGTCITCGCVKPWRELQAGHAFAGRYNSILYCEAIVRPQCFFCNCRKGGAPDEYHKWLLDEYGQQGYDELLLLKHGKDKDGKDLNVKFTIDGLEKMIQGWKEEMKGFKCQ